MPWPSSTDLSSFSIDVSIELTHRTPCVSLWFPFPEQLNDMASKTKKRLDQPWESFRKFILSKGLRVTGQRRSIFEAVFDLSDHFTAEDLLDKARKIDKSVSRATVYRSLPLLSESSVIREVDVGRDSKFYAVNRDSENFKAQVICVDCEKIFEVDAPFMEWYGKTVSENLGLDVKTQRLQVHAECPGHDEKSKCPRTTEPPHA